MSTPILQVFNKYLFPGGEGKSVDRIFNHLAESHPMHRCFFDSAAWKGEDAPSTMGQVKRLFYNRESGAAFERSLDATGAKAALFHNIYPVGSPSLYHAALQRRLPVIQTASISSTSMVARNSSCRAAIGISSTSSLEHPWRRRQRVRTPARRGLACCLCRGILLPYVRTLEGGLSP